MISYKEFEDHIERIFVDKELEKQPTKVFTEFKVPSILDPQDVLNDSEERVLESCLQRLGTEIKHRRLLLKPYFQDKDKSKSGFVANTWFRSIFDFLKLYISEQEYEIINKWF